MGKRKGDDETRWRARLATEEMADRVRALVADEPDHRAQIWARVTLGGERKVDVARDFGYADGSGALQVVKRLESSAREDRSLARKLDKMRKSLSCVQS